MGRASRRAELAALVGTLQNRLGSLDSLDHGEREAARGIVAETLKTLEAALNPRRRTDTFERATRILRQLKSSGSSAPPIEVLCDRLCISKSRAYELLNTLTSQPRDHD